MKKISLFAIAIAIGFAGFAQTPATTTKSKAKTTTSKPAKKTGKMTSSKKTSTKSASTPAK